MPPTSELLHRGIAPRLLLLDHANSDDEPRAALVQPGRLPVFYVSLSRAIDALRQAAHP